MLLTLRYACRHLRRSPRFSLLAIATLTLAIGGTAAFASLLRGLVFRPLDMPHAEALVAVTAVDGQGVQGFISLAAFDELRRTQDVFDEVCGYGGSGNTTIAAEVNGAIVLRPMEGVAGQCFRMLGVQPLLGRLLPEPGSNSRDAEPVAVISYGFWQHEFAGDRSVIGQTLYVQGVPLTIIGVTPPGTPTLGVELMPDFTVPQAILPRVFRAPEAARVYYVIGRLHAGVTAAMAQARLSALWPAILKAGVSRFDDPAARYMHDLHDIRVRSAANGISPLRLRYEGPLFLLVGLATIVLIVACVNVGGLLLARAVAREGELAVHLALGATRPRVARQLLAEGIVLSAIAACAAFPLAFWIARSLVALLWNGPVPLKMRLTPNASAIAAMGLGALVCGLIVSVPAIAFWLTRPERAGCGQTRTVLAGTGWMGKTLVVLQLALSLALLFTAGLFLRNLANLRSIDPGYRTRGILWGRLNELPGRAPVKDPSAYGRELIAHLSQLPGVTSVSMSYLFPTATASRPLVGPVRAEGMPPGSDINAAPEFASPDFFNLTGVGLIEGRVFTWQDDTAHPAVAILNATLAQLLFPGGHALGKRIHSDRTPAAQEAEVVGIVRDASPGDIRISHIPILYRPIFQETLFLRVPVVAIRAEYPAGLRDAVRRTIASFDHHYPFNLYVLQDSIDRSLITERTLLVLSSFVGGLGLLLASLGLYALLAYTIGRRHRELGLRMALGASSRMLVQMVIREALMLVLLGIAMGAPAALGVGRLAGSMLFGLSPFDLLTLAATSLVLLAASIAALTDPARRVAALEPASALRAD